jgi:CRISPR system Cascade subunit CasB
MNAAVKTESLDVWVIRPFIESLERLYANQDRGALADLRRGLGKAPGAAMEMHPYVVPFTRELNRRQEDAFYVVAALFGLYPRESWRRGEREKFFNLGASLKLLKKEKDSGGVERRFVALLNCRAEDLPDHLRQFIGLIKTNDLPIDWGQLLRDIIRWDFDEDVQRNWAKAFWAADPKPETAEPDAAPETDASTAD